MRANCPYLIIRNSLYFAPPPPPGGGGGGQMSDLYHVSLFYKNLSSNVSV